MSVVVHRVVINSLLRDAGGPVGRHLQARGLRVQNGAKRLCPVDTGRLRSSISVSSPRLRNPHQMTVSVGTNVNYARFVELGTRYMRARPYLRPALMNEMRR